MLMVSVIFWQYENSGGRRVMVSFGWRMVEEGRNEKGVFRTRVDKAASEIGGNVITFEEGGVVISFLFWMELKLD